MIFPTLMFSLSGPLLPQCEKKDRSDNRNLMILDQHSDGLAFNIHILNLTTELFCSAGRKNTRVLVRWQAGQFLRLWYRFSFVYRVRTMYLEDFKSFQKPSWTSIHLWFVIVLSPPLLNVEKLRLIHWFAEGLVFFFFFFSENRNAKRFVIMW